MVESGTHQQIGYILRSYPRLSQTFILNEILALEQAGVNIQIFALTNPQEEIIQPQVDQVHAPVHYLDHGSQNAGGSTWLGRVLDHASILWRHPIGYLRALVYTLRNKKIDKGYTSSSRAECFNMAVTLARLAGPAGRHGEPRIDHLHAHFAHDPTFIAQLVHLITGISYSFTAHARDLFQVPVTALTERIRRASAVVTCCQNNLNYLFQVAPAERARFSMIYHGVNIQRFRPAAKGREKPNPPLILSVGRLVEKKGYLDLIAALQLVKERGGRFQCAIYGEGPLQEEIARAIEACGLAGWVNLLGPVDQTQLLSIFQRATLFALTPTVTEDGDRDGIPNVLTEAMAVCLPVVSTMAAGIPELITHNQNGLLYTPHDINGIATGIMELLDDEGKRERLGKAARVRVIEQFDARQAASTLKQLFTRSLLPSEYRERVQSDGFEYRSYRS
jgi:glycosyltransferase involved in cell wall biosynthesis